MRTIMIRLFIFLAALALTIIYLLKNDGQSFGSLGHFDPVFRYGVLIGISVAYFSSFIESVITFFQGKRKTEGRAEKCQELLQQKTY
jgi:hypothetical protein